MAFNPGQARDKNGKWTKGAGVARLAEELKKLSVGKDLEIGEGSGLRVKAVAIKDQGRTQRMFQIAAPSEMVKTPQDKAEVTKPHRTAEGASKAALDMSARQRHDNALGGKQDLGSAAKVEAKYGGARPTPGGKPLKSMSEGDLQKLAKSGSPRNLEALQELRKREKAGKLKDETSPQRQARERAEAFLKANPEFRAAKAAGDGSNIFDKYDEDGLDHVLSGKGFSMTDKQRSQALRAAKRKGMDVSKYEKPMADGAAKKDSPPANETVEQFRRRRRKERRLARKEKAAGGSPKGESTADKAKRLQKVADQRERQRKNERENKKIADQNLRMNKKSKQAEKSVDINSLPKRTEKIRPGLVVNPKGGSPHVITSELDKNGYAKSHAINTKTGRFFKSGGGSYKYPDGTTRSAVGTHELPTKPGAPHNVKPFGNAPASNEGPGGFKTGDRVGIKHKDGGGSGGLSDEQKKFAADTSNARDRDIYTPDIRSKFAEVNSQFAKAKPTELKNGPDAENIGKAAQAILKHDPNGRARVEREVASLRKLAELAPDEKSRALWSAQADAYESHLGSGGKETPSPGARQKGGMKGAHDAAKKRQQGIQDFHKDAGGSGSGGDHKALLAEAKAMEKEYSARYENMSNAERLAGSAAIYAKHQEARRAAPDLATEIKMSKGSGVSHQLAITEAIGRRALGIDLHDHTRYPSGSDARMKAITEINNSPLGQEMQKEEDRLYKEVQGRLSKSQVLSALDRVLGKHDDPGKTKVGMPPGHRDMLDKNPLEAGGGGGNKGVGDRSRKSAGGQGSGGDGGGGNKALQDAIARAHEPKPKGEVTDHNQDLRGYKKAGQSGLRPGDRVTVFKAFDGKDQAGTVMTVHKNGTASVDEDHPDDRSKMKVVGDSVRVMLDNGIDLSTDSHAYGRPAMEKIGGTESAIQVEARSLLPGHEVVHNGETHKVTQVGQVLNESGSGIDPNNMSVHLEHPSGATTQMTVPKTQKFETPTKSKTQPKGAPKK